MRDVIPAAADFIEEHILDIILVVSAYCTLIVFVFLHS